MCEQIITDIPHGLDDAMMALRGDQCRWPFGDPLDPAFCFCTKNKARGPYCAERFDRAWLSVAPGTDGDMPAGVVSVSAAPRPSTDKVTDNRGEADSDVSARRKGVL